MPSFTHQTPRHVVQPHQENATATTKWRATTDTACLSNIVVTASTTVATLLTRAYAVRWWWLSMMMVTVMSAIKDWSYDKGGFRMLLKGRCKWQSHEVVCVLFRRALKPHRGNWTKGRKSIAAEDGLSGSHTSSSDAVSGSRTTSCDAVSGSIRVLVMLCLLPTPVLLMMCLGPTPVLVMLCLGPIPVLVLLCLCP